MIVGTVKFWLSERHENLTGNTGEPRILSYVCLPASAAAAGSRLEIATFSSVHGRPFCSSNFAYPLLLAKAETIIARAFVCYESCMTVTSFMVTVYRPFGYNRGGV